MNRAFWQPRRLVFWVYAVMVFLGGLVTVLSQVFAGFIAPGAVLPALGGVVVLGPVMVVVLALVQGPDRPPATARWAGLVWGGLAAVSVASVANEVLGSVVIKISGRAHAVDWSAAWVAPTSEETVKLAGIVAVACIAREHIRRPADGLGLGMAVGLGFQLVENLSYCLLAASEAPNSDAGAAVEVLVARSAAGLASHWVFSGFAGFGVGYVLTRAGRSAAHRWLVAGGMFALAYAAHWFWNSPLLWFETVLDGFLGIAVKTAVILAAFAVVVGWADRLSWRWFAANLAGEHPDVITPEELAAMRTRRSRRRAKLGARRQRAFIALARARHDSPAPEADPVVAQRRWAVAGLRPTPVHG
ncbi:PrsW family intramembrane metalloprotease [Saccharopolyspora taberi]|uniref:PrsW family intramembrane metalloprotease n=1 Tax=Saccharopolyspora taberi TaxID=60895 RepID=A0ABN3VEF5_9PSEU